ncbi:hypothetical protein [Sphaerotilus microaerophilus]|uniref:Uncharacterized protein n=1 Tax=Sphaerotilus microaerophilus TaxID=2914710 RepID=A0ABM7YQP8_9BURK|nr:hypothetical protein [Sphaerotilus sp. FB-5]BDI06878.1 hypothetical protein CATMQ487_38480 [Sphaerotilus sp. FB-5]
MSPHLPCVSTAARLRRAALAVALLALQTTLSAPAQAQGPAQAQPPAASGASAAAPGAAKASPARRSPDAATQQTMQRLRELLARQREAVEQQKLASADYRTLADQVDAQLDELAKSAGKPPSAQRKAFNAIVERDLRWATDTMRRSPKPEAQRTGALAAFQAMRNYGNFFDHPGWTWP